MFDKDERTNIVHLLEEFLGEYNHVNHVVAGNLSILAAQFI